MLIFTHGYKVCNVNNLVVTFSLTFVTFCVDREIVPLQRADCEFLWKV